MANTTIPLELSAYAPTASGATLELQTTDTTVTDGSVLGKIEFKAPSEASGTDAILVGAAIEAVAEGTFAADNNATELLFKTGVSEAAATKMVLTSAGKLGIGETSPDALLHLKGATATNEASHILFENTQGAKQFAVGAGTSGVTNNNFVIRNVTDNTFPLAITDAGKLGIGDTSPFAQLHVEDTGWSSGAPYGTVVYIQGGATNDANWGHLMVTQSGTTTDTGGRISFGANGENPIAGIRAKYKGATYGDLAFMTRPSGGTNTENLVITSGGDIVIGSTSKIYSSGDDDNYLQFNQANTFRFVTGDTTTISGTPTEIAFNEDSANMDIRFESDDNANMFNVDAGGNIVTIGSGTVYVGSCLQVCQQPGYEKHLISLTSGTDSTISGSGQSAKYAEGVVACNTTSAGNTISIPITSQANLWRQYQVEIMVCSAEYNSSTGDDRGGTAKFGITSLNSLSIANVSVTGNISGVTVSGMNVLVEFSSAFTDGLSNYEGCVMYYKVLGLTPEYFEGWAATLD